MVLMWMCCRQMVSPEQRSVMASLAALLVLEIQAREWRFRHLKYI